MVVSLLVIGWLLPLRLGTDGEGHGTEEAQLLLLVSDEQLLVHGVLGLEKGV